MSKAGTCIPSRFAILQAVAGHGFSGVTVQYIIRSISVVEMGSVANSLWQASSAKSLIPSV